jgi:predicted Zn finger-like uncharacterized protein
MIIACPACATRYVVPDSAIGVEGRTVRCAKCRHSWFQDGPAVAAPHAPPPVPPPPPPPPREPAPEPDEAAVENVPVSEQATAFQPGETFAEPAPEPPSFAREQPAPVLAQPPVAPPPERPAAADDYFDEAPSSFAHEPPFRPRRNPARLWTAAAIAFALLVAALIGAVSWYGLPAWAPIAQQTFAEQQPDLQLEFPADRQDRRTLPNGAEYFGASGTVTNIGQETRDVPPILIVLRDGRDRIVYTWEVASPKAELAPGESVTINEAVTDVPRSARVAEIGWKPG